MKSMLGEMVALLSAGPGDRALARWPALAAEAVKAAQRVGAGGEGDDLVAAVGGAILTWLLERARWLDGAFAQAASGAAARGFPANYTAVA